MTGKFEVYPAGCRWRLHRRSRLLTTQAPVSAPSRAYNTLRKLGNGTTTDNTQECSTGTSSAAYPRRAQICGWRRGGFRCATRLRPVGCFGRSRR
jgi:hypothetical protein